MVAQLRIALAIISHEIGVVSTLDVADISLEKSSNPCNDILKSSMLKNVEIFASFSSKVKLETFCYSGDCMLLGLDKGMVDATETIPQQIYTFLPSLTFVDLYMLF